MYISYDLLAGVIVIQNGKILAVSKIFDDIPNIKNERSKEGEAAANIIRYFDLNSDEDITISFVDSINNPRKDVVVKIN